DSPHLSPLPPGASAPQLVRALAAAVRVRRSVPDVRARQNRSLPSGRSCEVALRAKRHESAEATAGIGPAVGVLQPRPLRLGAFRRVCLGPTCAVASRCAPARSWPLLSNCCQNRNRGTAASCPVRCLVCDERPLPDELAQAVAFVRLQLR